MKKSSTNSSNTSKPGMDNFVGKKGVHGIFRILGKY